MTLPETLTFACPACDSRLTVPIALAGVVGPCPRCGTRIQAPPLPVPAATQSPVHAPAPAAAPAPASVPVYAAPTYATTPPPQEAPAGPAPGGTGYKPEPRQLPQRVEGKEPIGRRMSEAMRAQDDEVVGGYRRSPLVRMIIPALFLTVLLAMVGVILLFLNQKPPVEVTPLPQPASPAQADSGLNSGSGPSHSDLPPRAAEPDESLPVAPPADPGGIGASSRPVDLSSQPVAKPPATSSATQVLEKFLAAKTLDERRPLMETATPDDELKSSCLSGPLPVCIGINVGLQSDSLVERSTDYFYTVTFARPNSRGDSYDVLVRRRGDQEPKVVVDPFLDLYGGRLKKFATTPTTAVGTFQARVTVIAGLVSDPNIPKRDNKMILKLTATQSENHEIATVYASTSSRISDLLKEGGGLSYGQSTPCTIELLWDVKDNPAHPFIEAISIKVLSWNQ